ncbi:MAG: FkbM family methyltransferase [Proteobacteria bacterium]|nr:FkbM family methyltransferase [Pseudomonadota bacterium]
MAEYFQWKLTGSWLAHSFKAIFKQHHKDHIELFRKLVPVDAVVFDVGAHAGQFAKIFSKLAANGTVFCVEPGSYARTVLRPALWWNNCKNCVVLPIALDNSNQLTSLSMPEKRKNVFGFGLTRLSSDIGDSETRYKLVKDVCAAFTIDDVIKALSIERLDFIKADIEGFELNMLQGAEEALKTLKPVIYIEINDDYLKRAGATKEMVWSFLEGLDYIPYRLDSNTHQFMKLDPSIAVGGDILWTHKSSSF